MQINAKISSPIIVSWKSKNLEWPQIGAIMQLEFIRLYALPSSGILISFVALVMIVIR